MESSRSAPVAPAVRVSAAAPVIAALRAATAASHQAIEGLLRLDEHIGRERHDLILAGFDRFLRGWEPQVLAALPARLHGWFNGRSRRRFLAADLRDLGIERAPGPAPAVPELRGLAAAFGSMYVLEGSALGGQVIARRLAARFGFVDGSGAAYFNGWGERTGTMWREFRELLEAEVGPDPGQHAVASDAAVRTFDALALNFSELLREQHTPA